MKHGPVAQEFAKKGCPITYRVDLWKHILCVHVDDIVSMSLYAPSKSHAQNRKDKLPCHI